VLLDVGGQDSTEAFEDVGHSDEAREILEGLLVGTLKRQVRLAVISPAGSTTLLSARFSRLLTPPPKPIPRRTSVP
jgi:cytochrome b involved in lipid metabolism